MSSVMEGSSVRKLRIVALGLLLALGMALPPVHASDMTMTSDMASDSCIAGKAGCDLGGVDHGGSTECGTICPAMFLAVLPAELRVVVLDGDQPLMPATTAYAGRSFSPDPAPPRPIDPS